MNEKELREQFELEQVGFVGLSTDFDSKAVCDWFIARIKERDERLKNAVLANTGLQNDECCMDIQVFSVNDVLKIIDNHD